jgi:hypothetical protein
MFYQTFKLFVITHFLENLRHLISSSSRNDLGEDNTNINSFTCGYLGTSTHIYWKFIQYFRCNTYRKMVENLWVVVNYLLMYSGGLEYESWVQSGCTEISLCLPSYHQIIPRTYLNPTKFSVWISPAFGWLHASTAVSLECCTALIGSKLPTFRDSLSVPSSKVKQSKFPETTSTSMFNSFDHIDLLILWSIK